MHKFRAVAFLFLFWVTNKMLCLLLWVSLTISYYFNAELINILFGFVMQSNINPKKQFNVFAHAFRILIVFLKWARFLLLKDRERSSTIFYNRERSSTICSTVATVTLILNQLNNHFSLFLWLLQSWEVERWKNSQYERCFISILSVVVVLSLAVSTCCVTRTIV